MHKLLVDRLLSSKDVSLLNEKRLFEAIRQQEIDLKEYSKEQQALILSNLDDSMRIANYIERNMNVYKSLLDRHLSLDKISEVWLTEPEVYYSVYKDRNKIYTSVGLSFEQNSGVISYNGSKTDFLDYFDAIYNNFLKQLIQKSGVSVSQYTKCRRQKNKFEISKYIKI